MRVMVTGGAGYVGAHTVRALLEEGHEVLVIDDLSQGHRSAIPQEVKFLRGDFADPRVLEEAASWGPQGVIHFAARTSVAESVREPMAYYHQNLGKSLQLVEWMIARGVRLLVLSSTAAVYGEPETTPIQEDHPHRPTSPYGHSKSLLEKTLRLLAPGRLQVCCLRYFNAAGAHPSGEIGEDHRPETHLIPLLCKVALGQVERIQVFGADYPTPDGTAIRDYVHVCDLADAHIRALTLLATGGAAFAYNLGTGRGYSVLEVIRTARRVIPHPIPVEFAPRRPGDPAKLVASAERAEREMGWRRRYSDLETIIATAWRWHSTHPRGYDQEQVG